MENYFVIPSSFRTSLVSAVSIWDRDYHLGEGKKKKDTSLLSAVFNQKHPVTDAVRDQTPDYMDLRLIQLVFTSVRG